MSEVIKTKFKQADKRGDFFDTQKSIWFEAGVICQNFKLDGCCLWTLDQGQLDPVVGKALDAMPSNILYSHLEKATHGVGLIFAEKYSSSQPIYILMDGASSNRDVAPFSLIVFAADQAHAQVHQVHMHEDPSFQQQTIVFGHKASRIDHVTVSKNGFGSKFNHRLIYHAGQSSKINAYTYTLSGDQTKQDIDVLLAGEGAGCVLDGLFLGFETSKVSTKTHVHHLKSHTQSSETYKGVLGDQAKGVFKGRISVAKNVKAIQASQLNQNVLLSETATIDTSPELEILADDVKCSHGATVGSMDMEQLYYLQSRGIEKTEAKRLLLQGFVSDVIPNTVHVDFKPWITTQIEGQLK